MTYIQAIAENRSEAAEVTCCGRALHTLGYNSRMWQTDWRTDIGQRLVSRLRIVSRGKTGEDYAVWRKIWLMQYPFCYSIKYTVFSLSTRICAAEMAVRYAALSACRKVRMPSVSAEKYMCVIVIR